MHELERFCNETFALQLAGSTFEQLKNKLTEKISDLIDRDFNQLVNLLYRIDVDEDLLKKLLKENATAEAAGIIAVLIIERQLQKIRIGKEERQDNFGSEEKW